MENQKAPEQAEQAVPVKLEDNKEAQSTPQSTYDPVKLLSEAKGFLKEMGSLSVEGFGLPKFIQKDSAAKAAAPATKPAESVAEKPATAPSKADNTQEPSEPKPAEKNPAADLPEIKIVPKVAAQDSSQQASPEKPAQPVDTKKPGTPVLDKAGLEIADKVIDKIKDSTDPVKDIKDALKKLDNLNDATVTMNGKSSHIDIHLLSGKTAAPPNISVRGFRPVASHIDSHISFDLTPSRGGFAVTNMDGFSSSVRGPLGRIRHSETNSMFIGKDAYGPYINTSSDLYMRRRVHSSTTTLREQNMPADSPMRSLMQHPESLDKVNSMLRLFQSTEDISKLGIKRNGDAFDVRSEAKKPNHVELNFSPKPENMPIPVPVTIRSLDMEKNLTASLTQEKDSVTLGKIDGLKVNIEIGKLKASVCPTKVSIEKDKINLELKNPEDGSLMPVSIPISKLREAAEKMKK